jgi:hypothetical protein
MVKLWWIGGEIVVFCTVFFAGEKHATFWKKFFENSFQTHGVGSEAAFIDSGVQFLESFRPFTLTGPMGGSILQRILRPSLPPGS